jgi:nitrite reductase/ring-hydroxylating ferredoxin subunit
MDDRCGHMNAGLSMGKISNDGMVTCHFHGARFDATTGKKDISNQLSNRVIRKEEETSSSNWNVIDVV